MPVYIRASTMVSAQETFVNKAIIDQAIVTGKECMKVIAPDYKTYLPGALRRRMSPLVKFSLVSAFDCIGQVEDMEIDVVITATGLGCIDDTGVFLNQMHENGEKLLNPTAFIRSTHNAVGGQIALIKTIRNSNLTYTQKEVSFETALTDALLLIDSKEANNVLVGAFDEVTNLSVNLWKNMGCLSSVEVDKESLLASNNHGVVLGEGAGFFMLSSQADNSTCSQLLAVEVIHADATEVTILSDNFLAQNNLTASDIDLLILGLDGSSKTQPLLQLMNQASETTTVAGFKHLSGCYDTDTAFALWLGNSAIKNESIAQTCCLKGERNKDFGKVLIVNSSNKNSYSFSLLQKC